MLVTGGTGFLGGRLVEKLMLEHDAEVRVLVRDYGHAVRVARFPVEFDRGSLDDPASLAAAVEGCDYVFHCAHDFRDQQANVPASRALAEAALRQGVRRFVYVSSVSVHEPLPARGVVDESSPTPAGYEYAQVKLAVEREMERYGRERGLPAVNIRPTIVYGPYSPPWTLGPVAALLNKRVVLPARGEGLCWAVYVDDVVDAMVASAVRPEAVGQTFLVSGPDRVTWREFYGAYEATLGVESVVTLDDPAEDGASGNGAAPALDASRVLAHPAARWLYRRARSVGGRRLWDAARERVRPYKLPESPSQTALFSMRAEVSIEKARRLLGYEPRFDLERGMALTSEYIHWAQLDRVWWL